MKTHPSRNPLHSLGRAALLLVGAALAGPVPAQGAGETTPDGLARAIEVALGERHYEALWQVGVPAAGVEAAWQAPNRAQGLRTFFLPAGPLVRPRAATGDGWRLGLRLESLARGAARRPVDAGRLGVDGRRATYDRGDLVEWYVNDERGLEQGFDLLVRPLADGAGPLELRFALDGGARGRLEPGARGIRFELAGGRTPLALRGLVAHDAAGRSLDCEFALDEGAWLLRVHDGAATYPIVIDPTLVGEESALQATGEPADAQFGSSLDLWDDFAVVGAPGVGGGVAYLFEANPAGTWTFHSKLVADDCDYGSQFGADVALNGNYVFVGAPNDGQFGYRAGAVYVFTRQPGGGVELRDKIGSSTPSAQGHFGASLDANTHRLVVGAPHESNGGYGAAGAVHSFEPHDSSWAHHQRVAPSSPAANENFGSAVDVEHDDLAIGRPGYDHATGTGSVRLYGKLNLGQWIFAAEVTADSTDDLGKAVDLEEDFLVAGSPRTDFAGRADCGAVSLFEQFGSTWLHRDTEFGFSAGNELGTSVAVDQAESGAVTLAVGETGRDADRGAVILYGVDNTGMFFERLLTSASYSAGSRVGSSVVLEGERLLTGARMADVGQKRPGRVLAFEEEGGLWLPNGSLAGRDRETGERFGYSVALAGELAVVGVPRDNERASRAGGAWVFEREDGAWSGATKLHPLGDAEALGRFGHAVATDGVSVVVGAPGERVGEQRSGAAYVFRRDILGDFGSFVRLEPDDAHHGMEFGQTVAVYGNRVVVGATLGDGHVANCGAVYLFERGFSWTQTHKLFDPSGSPLDGFGAALAFDGAELFVGAPNHHTAAPGTGVVAQYLAPEGGAVSLQAHYWPAEVGPDAGFGSSLSLSQGRFAAGAPGEQAVFVYERGGGTLYGEAFDLRRGRSSFGRHVALEGDRLAVGAHAWAGHFVERGGLWLERELRPSEGAFDSLGADVAAPPLAIAGGLVLAGDPLQDLELEDEGRVYAFRPDEPGPIQLYGFGDGQDLDCPCGNEASAESGCLNSTGVGARLRGFGTAGVALDDLRLKVFGLPAGKWSLLIEGRDPVPGAVLGDGLRVAGGPVQRQGLRLSSAAGEAEWEPSLADEEPGALRYYQVFYRDLASGPCGTGVNTSNGVQVLLQP